jgi:hypothetical protein
MVAGLGIEEGHQAPPKTTKSNKFNTGNTPNLEQIRHRMLGCFNALPHQAHFDWDTKRNCYSSVAAGFLVSFWTSEMGKP